MQVFKNTFFRLPDHTSTLLCSLIFYFSFVVSSVAQTTYCDQNLVTEIDTLSDELMVHARQNIIVSADGGKTGFAVYGAYIHETVGLTIHSVGAGACVKEGDRVQFIFTDSAKLEVANMAKFNCQAESSIYFNTALNNMDQLLLLSEKQIVKITVWTKGKFLTRNVNDQTSAEIRELFSCLHGVFGRKPKLLGDKIFSIVEAQPEYIGGYAAMMTFIGQNLKIPKGWKKKDAIGTVEIQFVIAKDGSVTKVKTIKSLHPDLDQEAERVVKMMPAWRPGMQNGKPVYVTFIVPVRFN